MEQRKNDILNSRFTRNTCLLPPPPPPAPLPVVNHIIIPEPLIFPHHTRLKIFISASLHINLSLAIKRLLIMEVTRHVIFGTLNSGSLVGSAE